MPRNDCCRGFHAASAVRQETAAGFAIAAESLLGSGRIRQLQAQRRRRQTDRVSAVGVGEVEVSEACDALLSFVGELAG